LTAFNILRSHSRGRSQPKTDAGFKEAVVKTQRGKLCPRIKHVSEARDKKNVFAFRSLFLALTPRELVINTPRHVSRQQLKRAHALNQQSFRMSFKTAHWKLHTHGSVFCDWWVQLKTAFQLLLFTGAFACRFLKLWAHGQHSAALSGVCGTTCNYWYTGI